MQNILVNKCWPSALFRNREKISSQNVTFKAESKIWVPWGTTMVPKILFSKNAGYQLSFDVSSIFIRVLVFEISWKTLGDSLRCPGLYRNKELLWDDVLQRYLIHTRRNLQWHSYCVLKIIARNVRIYFFLKKIQILMTIIRW